VLPLGNAYDLEAISRVLPSNSLGSGSFEIDYERRPMQEQAVIRGKGLRQTYLIFGGPGAGKTYYFKYLLSRMLAHPDRPGCLLLDPKGSELTPWLEQQLAKTNREITVLSVNAGSQHAFNVLGQDLSPKELGRLLSEVVLTGAGVDESWAVLVGDLLEAGAVVIAEASNVLPEYTGKPLTAARLLNNILYHSAFKDRDGLKSEYPIVVKALRLARKTTSAEVRIACDRIAEYFSTSLQPNQRRFVRQIIERSVGELMLPQWRYLSSVTAGNTLYSDIIDKGRVVSVAVGQSSPAFQRSLSTLVKAIFQQAVLANLSRVTNENANRPESEKKKIPFFILACDEYAQAITEGQTGLVSDSRFFSLSREAGCLSLLALQSVATGRSRFPAEMHDRWEGILGNVTVKFFMRVNDVETAELASSLMGSRHSFVKVLSQQASAQGPSTTDSVTMIEHRRVPPWYLTNRMPQGHALVHGTLDGESAPTTTFIEVPRSK